MMFWYGNGGWHPWMALLVFVGMLLFWALVVWGAFTLFRGSGGGGQGTARPDPEQILKERLARGEIDPEEYGRLRELINSDS